MTQAKDTIASIPAARAVALYHHLARAIAACFGIGRGWREQLIASLAGAAAPVAPSSRETATAGRTQGHPSVPLLSARELDD